MNKSLSSCEKIIEDIPKRIKRIEYLSKKYKLARLDILAKKLRIACNTANHNHIENLKVCNYLESKYLNLDSTKITVDLHYKELIFLKLYSLYVMNRNEEGIKYAYKTSSIFKSGDFDWFKFNEYHFLLLMKAEKFHQATKVFRSIRINKNFHKLPMIDQERWKIYRVYLLFVNDSKLIKWGFDIDNFKKIVPDFGKEYQGYNVAILIIQFLLYFREADIKNLKIKLNRLAQLSSVHLDKRHNYRNSIFIRMLEIISEKEFNYELISEKGATYLRKLITYQIPPDWLQELEVIPYEKLWEYVLNILKTSKYYLHYRFYKLHEVE